MEAGNRCFDQRVPEEINRRIVDHTSDINLPYSDIARDYLLREGLLPDQVIKTGSPMFEVINYYMSQIDKSDAMLRFGLVAGKYFVVSAHREENIDLMLHSKTYKSAFRALSNISFTCSSFNSSTQKRIDRSGLKSDKAILFAKPLDFLTMSIFKSMQSVLSDSGTINEEHYFVDFPALNLREAHERPEGMEEAAVMMVGLEIERIKQAMNILNDQNKIERSNHKIVPDYSVPNVSEKIVKIIHSYTDYANRVVGKNIEFYALQ